jgi:predicted nucleic acid-binding Zn ribbon protein
MKGGANMLVCPMCKAEYQDGYTVCSDCECNLVEQSKNHVEGYKEQKDFKIIQFVMGTLAIIGVLVILFSTLLSYKFTSMYFIPNGNGQYSMEQFIWMLNAYHHSFLLIGIIICLLCIVYWFKEYRSK